MEFKVGLRVGLGMRLSVNIIEERMVFIRLFRSKMAGLDKEQIDKKLLSVAMRSGIYYSLFATKTNFSHAWPSSKAILVKE